MTKLCRLLRRRPRPSNTPEHWAACAAPATPSTAACTRVSILPCTWPSTTVELARCPTSFTPTKRHNSSTPVSGSTSTSHSQWKRRAQTSGRCRLHHDHASRIQVKVHSDELFHALLRLHAKHCHCHLPHSRLSEANPPCGLPRYCTSLRGHPQAITTANSRCGITKQQHRVVSL